MNRRWTKREDNLLRRCYPDGGWAAVCNRLPGRALGTVTRRVRELGITARLEDIKQPGVTKPEPLHAHEIKTRACLRCRAAFVSAWAGERICRGCKDSAVWQAGAAEPLSTGRAVRPSGSGSGT